MNWVFDFLRTSIGKKLMMAITGLGFCLFLVIHLIGNLTIYGGKELFTSYVEHLHSLGPIILVAEIVLLLMAIIHVSNGLVLFYQNFSARPIRYAVKKKAGGRTIGSATMPYTGVVILVFIIIHLLNFHFIDQTQQTVYQAIQSTFSILYYVVFYVLAVCLVAIHVSHGFWSLFQTIGANHPKYMPFIKSLAIVFSVVVGIGFGFIPIYIGFIA